MTKYLCLFRWFHPCSELISTENENIISTQINWSPCMRGPVGNGGGDQKDQSYFDDNVFSGLEIFHSEYINALKLLNDSNEMNRKGTQVDHLLNYIIYFNYILFSLTYFIQILLSSVKWTRNVQHMSFY